MMNDTKTLTSKCPICNDSGFVYFLGEDGNEYSMTCTCQYKGIAETILKASGFPQDAFERMSLTNFKADSKEQAEMKELAERYLKSNSSNWVGYFGKSGTGKTHICIALCQELVKTRLCSFSYQSYRTMIRNMRADLFKADSYAEKLNKLIECDLLYIDDFMKFSKDQNGEIVQDELRVLHDIINERYIRQKITIISSEYSLKEIVLIDEALGSRLRQMIGDYGIYLQGKNYRL